MPVLYNMINSDTRQFVRPGAWRVAHPCKEYRNEQAVGGSAKTKPPLILRIIQSESGV